jgi:hypothetical protein
LEDVEVLASHAFILRDNVFSSLFSFLILREFVHEDLVVELVLLDDFTVHGLRVHKVELLLQVFDLLLPLLDVAFEDLDLPFILVHHFLVQKLGLLSLVTHHLLGRDLRGLDHVHVLELRHHLLVPLLLDLVVLQGLLV